MNLHVGAATGGLGEVWVGVIAPSLPDFKDIKAGVYSMRQHWAELERLGTDHQAWGGKDENLMELP